MNDHDQEIGERHGREREFHDKKYGGASDGPAVYKVNPTYRVFQDMKSRLGNLSGKTVLEIGCGNGWITKELAQLGATVHAFDISPESVRRTREELQRLGLADRCDLRVMAAEDMLYPRSSFDVVVGFAILHHLDLDRSFEQFRRVLRPGGRVLAAEPLGGNPAIDIYRKLTPQFRTPDEKPIDLDSFVEKFSAEWHISHKEYYLTSIASLGLTFLPGGLSVYGPVNRALNRLDEALLGAWPSLGKYAWYTVLDISRRDGAHNETVGAG